MARTIPKEHLVELILGELSHVLWQQRDLITNLVYRLDVQRSVLAQGRERWMHLATEDVNAALEDVRRQEQFRNELLADLSAATGISADVSLKELITIVRPPWDGILAEHHAAFLALTAEAEQLSRANAELLQRGLSDLDDLLSTLSNSGGGDSGVSGYEQAGRTNSHRPRQSPSGTGGALLVDRDA